MPDQIKFIVYSDIHYDRLGARCVTIEDCEEIERAVHHRFIEGYFDFSIFCGDRFLKREPEDEVKTRADAILFRLIKGRELAPHYHLVGNHDWVTRSKRWHTSRSLDWGDTLDCIKILDKPYTCSYSDGVKIHALPAGFEMDMNNYQINPDVLNIFIFHDMVMGCKLDDEGRVIAETGMRLSDIDRPEFDLVLGGDIHIPQRLPFKNTTGGYVGAVLQRTRADANCERGWMEITATRDLQATILEDRYWYFDINFVPVREFFTKFSFEVDDSSSYEGIQLDEKRIIDTHCEVELIGSRANVDRIANDKRWENYKDFFNVRDLMLTRKYKVEQREVVVDMSESSGTLDDLNMYLDSGFVDIGNLSRESITGMVNSILEDK